tara:strand:- start:8446 stop:9342 length:897 start_codon:yes stop_codon:yes gene_type:complete
MIFGRQYKLTIGEPLKEGILIQDLNINFKILKSDDADDANSGTATIKVFNLSEKSIARIQKDNAVILQAGYKSSKIEPLVIFAGDVLMVSSIKIGENLVTTIVCAEGYVPKREGYTSRTFKGGVLGITVGGVIREIATLDMGLPVAQIDNGDLGGNKGVNKVFQQNTVYLGNSAEILNILTKNNELTWIIRNGSVYVYPINGSTKVTQIRSLSADSGMIGSPEKLVTKPSKLKDTKDLKQGYKVKILINGAVNIGDLVAIESASVSDDKVFRISKITTDGELEGANWTMVLELLEGVK